MEEEFNQQDTTPTPGEEAEVVEAEAGPEEPQPSAGDGLARRALQWAAGIGFVFLLGVLVVFFLRVRPQADRIKSLERSLGESQNRISELQAELDRLGPLEEENDELRQELAVRDLHLDLLSVLVDVTRARLALAEDQPGTADSTLQGTDRQLASLEEGLAEEHAEAVGALRDRLGLVLQELETDQFAAERDLEILSNNLVDLERRVFGE